MRCRVRQQPRPVVGAARRPLERGVLAQPVAVPNLRLGCRRRVSATRDQVLLDDEPAVVAVARARRRTPSRSTSPVPELAEDAAAPRFGHAGASAITPASTSLWTSFRWTWPMRSPQSRSACIGSPPPSARWPGVEQQPDSVSSSRRSISHGASTYVPCGGGRPARSRARAPGRRRARLLRPAASSPRRRGRSTGPTLRGPESECARRSPRPRARPSPRRLRPRRTDRASRSSPRGLRPSARAR